MQYLREALAEKGELVVELEQRVNEVGWASMEKEHEWETMARKMVEEQQQRADLQIKTVLEEAKDQLQQEALKKVEKDYEIVIDKLLMQHKKEVSALRKEIG